MKIPTTEEYILEVTDLINTQNKRIKKYFSVEEIEKKQASVKYTEAVSKFEQIKKYVVDKLLPALNNIVINDRYIFSFIDGTLGEYNSNYFKLIIKNKSTNKTNFILFTNDVYDIFIKIKSPNSDDDLEINKITYPLQKFTKGKYRKIFFEYLQQIIQLDTLPKLKHKKILEENKMDKIMSLNADIDRMRQITERNKNMLIEASTKQVILKQNKEKIEQNSSINDK